MRKSIFLMCILPCMVLVPMQQYSLCYGEDILSAVRSKSLSEIQELVSRGADIRAKDRYDDSILHKAAWRGDYSIMQYLLTINGIDVHARSKKGETPLHLAAK